MDSRFGKEIGLFVDDLGYVLCAVYQMPPASSQSDFWLTVLRMVGQVFPCKPYKPRAPNSPT